LSNGIIMIWKHFERLSAQAASRFAWYGLCRSRHDQIRIVMSEDHMEA
jgi:hypothetical protein